MFHHFYKWVLVVLSIIGPIGSLIAFGRIDMSLIGGLGLLWGFYGLFNLWDKVQRDEDAEYTFKGWTFKFTKHKKAPHSHNNNKPLRLFF
jgi:hypothetical protein